MKRISPEMKTRRPHREIDGAFVFGVKEMCAYFGESRHMDLFPFPPATPTQSSRIRPDSVTIADSQFARHPSTDQSVKLGVIELIAGRCFTVFVISSAIAAILQKSSQWQLYTIFPDTPAPCRRLPLAIATPLKLTHILPVQFYKLTRSHSAFQTPRSLQHKTSISDLRKRQHPSLH